KTWNRVQPSTISWSGIRVLIASRFKGWWPSPPTARKLNRCALECRFSLIMEHQHPYAGFWPGIVLSPHMNWVGRLSKTVSCCNRLAGYELLITTDKSLFHQQNLHGRKIAIIALGQANWPIVETHIAQ